jgi:prepilin-type N-terminal cleavage/methylation domain-containing protein
VIRWPLQTGPVDSRRGAAGPIAVRGGFSLVELLVVMSIMVVLLGLVSAAVSGARASQKKQATRLLLAKLDTIIQQQMASYAARVVPPPPDANGDGSITQADLPSGWSKAAYRSWYIRRNLISGDLPDRWSDVAALASGTVPLSVSGTAKLPVTSPQRTYAAVWTSLSNQQRSDAHQQYAGAECLFMIVMQGGIADCIDCGELRTAERGDKDEDGLFEFWDAWGNPIGFILWPAGLQLPGGSGQSFFSGSRALETFPAARPSPTLGMRPLIYSAGPDGEYGFNRADEAATLTAGTSPVGGDCGSPASVPTQTMAAPLNSTAADNLTNLDLEAAK